MDRIDRHLIQVIQQQGRLPTAELAEMVGLSASPCARRLKRLEESGIIQGYSAVLNKKKIGIGMTVFVEVSLNSHQAEAIDRFEQTVLDMEEVISCHVVSGAYDYLLEVLSKDLTGYELFTRKLQCHDGVKDIHTHVAIRQVKEQSVLPLYI